MYSWWILFRGMLYFDILFHEKMVGMLRFDTKNQGEQLVMSWIVNKEHYVGVLGLSCMLEWNYLPPLPARYSYDYQRRSRAGTPGSLSDGGQEM